LAGHSTIRAALIYLHSTSTWLSLADTVTARVDSELPEADEPRATARHICGTT
jgi:hypothetical protein